MDIGNRVRQLRQKNGLTLEELASRTELTKGFLSQLERNLSSPSIATLEDIAEVLGVSLADFFKEESRQQIVFTPQDSFVDEKDDITITYIVPNSQRNMMEPLLLKIRPQGRSQVIEPHEGEELGYVLQGKIELENLTAGSVHAVRKGESFYISGDFRHCLTNSGSSDALVLWVSTPPVL
ncbi:MAG: helix-turn-helix transcriptional regulator [Erysipelotrichaceae bacterium]|nr:helix-turn-helix transcriptional regulator [Erysipelotrichaceae bacterium]MBR5049298.1 helix-turn-helix transcriptional regulator [Erysipelotrichaceae bacterium]